MHSTLTTINTIAGWIPSKVRGAIYGLIGLFWMLNQIWNILPDNTVGENIALTISLLGAIMAAANTDLVPDPNALRTDQRAHELRDLGQSALVTILIVVAIVVLVLIVVGRV